MCSTHVKNKGANKLLTGNPKEKELSGLSRSKGEDNIKMDFKLDWKGVEWNRWLKIVTIVWGCCEKSNGHLVSIKFEGYLD